MRICGRISKSGMKRSKAESQGAHFLLYEHSEIQNVDSCLEHTLQTMGPGDLFVTGANALDAFGHAALLIGSPGGGGYGTCMPFLLYSATVKQAQRQKKIGADVIALSCTGMSSIQIAPALERETGLPVLDPVMCEGLMTLFELIRKDAQAQ